MTSPITTTSYHDGAVEHILLDRPKANVLDAEMIGALRDHIRSLHANPGLRLIIFEGAGDHFCLGASVEEHTAEMAPGMLESFHAKFREIEELSVPTAALVRGMCLGGGLELAAFCSYVVAEMGAKLGQPEINLAVIAPMASILLPYRMGEGRAQDLLLTGRLIGARRAKRRGLVNQVAEPGFGDELLQRWTHKHILPKSASSLRFAYRAARMDLARRLRNELPRIERMYIAELMATHDANEGIAAFLEKRKPSFEN